MSDQTERTKKIERLNSLSKQHSDELNKYTYFILAVTGTAIAYALKALEEKQPSYSLIFICISICLWAISFGFGIRGLNKFREYLVLNTKCLLADLSAQDMVQKLDPLNRQIGFSNSCQFIFLITGSLCYMLFHATELLSKL